MFWNPGYIRAYREPNCTSNSLKVLFLPVIDFSKEGGRSPSYPLGPVHPSLRALSGRLKFTVRRHKFTKDFSPSERSTFSEKWEWNAARRRRGGRAGPVDPSFRTLSGRLKFAVRRDTFDKDSPSLPRPTPFCRLEFYIRTTGVPRSQETPTSLGPS